MKDSGHTVRIEADRISRIVELEAVLVDSAEMLVAADEVDVDHAALERILVNVVPTGIELADIRTISISTTPANVPGELARSFGSHPRSTEFVQTVQLMSASAQVGSKLFDCKIGGSPSPVEWRWRPVRNHMVQACLHEPDPHCWAKRGDVYVEIECP